MQNPKLTKLALALALLALPVPALTARPLENAGRPALERKTAEAVPIKPLGFADRDNDGVNDLFRDADGDGVNDATGRPYPHDFAFEDQDGDKLNDLFRDADGDGVNDLLDGAPGGGGPGPGRPALETWFHANVVDFDGDQINDITGLHFGRGSLRGYKFGNIREERQSMMRSFRFLDEDADGLGDRRGHGPRIDRPAAGQQQGDRFIDQDGDGIDDRRQGMHRIKGGARGGRR